MRNATGGCMLAAISFCANPAFAGDPWLRDGTYEIVTRLELPHLERYAVNSVHRVCFTGGWATKAIPAPVKRQPSVHPLRGRPYRAWRGTIEYDVACPGRDSARAHASYRATDNGFDGRVAMVMGGKNMTMTEVVRGRRLGACNETAELAPIRF